MPIDIRPVALIITGSNELQRLVEVFDSHSANTFEAWCKDNGLKFKPERYGVPENVIFDLGRDKALAAPDIRHPTDSIEVFFANEEIPDALVAEYGLVDVQFWQKYSIRFFKNGNSVLRVGTRKNIGNFDIPDLPDHLIDESDIWLFKYFSSSVNVNDSIERVIEIQGELQEAFMRANADKGLEESGFRARSGVLAFKGFDKFLDFDVRFERITR